MSYQPFPGQPGQPQQPPYGGPPAGPAPYVQQPAAPFTPVPVKGARRTGALVAGIVLLLVGIGGLVMFISGGKNYEDAVKDLARAPVGCTTSLEFDKTGTFTVYAETTGKIGNVRGDCANSDTDYARDSADVPDPDLTLTNEDGDEIDIDGENGKDYDAAGFVGTSIGTIQIEDTGSYELTVSSDEDDFAIAIGKDPKDAEGLKTVGLIALIAGGVLGILLIIIGLRRKPAGPSGEGMGTAPAYQAPPQYAPTMQQPTMAPPATYPPAQAPPAYNPPPTQPLPTTPPAPSPGTWSPPPPQP